MKRVFSFIIALCFCCSNLLACNNNGGQANIKITETAYYNQFAGVNKNVLKGYIVKGGASSYSIIIPEKEDEAIIYAAQELSDFILKSTGVQIPIEIEKKQSLEEGAKYISLGRTKLLTEANLEVDYSALNQDGFITKTVNDCIFIDGYRNSGVLYGVYNFLELFCEIQFLTTDSTYIPRLTEVPLYELNIKEVPSFAIRDYYSYQTMQDPEFSSRMRMKGTLISYSPKFGLGGDKDYYTPEGHTIELLLPASKYQAAHPDWYDSTGKELDYSNGINDDGDLDLTKETSAALEMIKVCKDIILSKPNATYLMLGTADNGAWSTSVRSNAFAAKFGGNSGTMIVYINAVAKALEEWIAKEKLDRKLKVVCLAYWKTQTAPLNMDTQGNITPVSQKSIPRDNVIVKIACMSCFTHQVNDTTCTKNASTRDTFSNWSKLTKNIFVWEYTVNFWNFFWYFPNLGVLKDNLQYYQSIGSTHIISQGAPHAQNFYISALQMYLFSKLMWNTNRDVRKLIETFNEYYFGKDYAPYVNDYLTHMNLHFSILDKEAKNGFHTALYDGADFTKFEFYPIGYLEKGMKYADDAIAKIKTDSKLSYEEKEKLINKFLGIKITPQYMILKNLTSYYSGTYAQDFAKDFFKNLDRLNITYYGESISVKSLKDFYKIYD